MDTTEQQKKLAFIQKHLDDFESDQGYLKTKITTNSLAEEWNTNAKYVSQGVKLWRNKSFNEYITKLRIDYAISVLQENSPISDYSLDAMATEFGFTSGRTFSDAFYKETGWRTQEFIQSGKIY